MKKQPLIILIFVIVASTAYAQTHISVSVSDPVYEFLETAQIRGLCERLPSAKPYARSLVVSALEDIQQRRSRLSPRDQQVLDNFLARFVDVPERNAWRSGKWEWEDDIFPGELGIRFGSEGSINLAETSELGLMAFGELFLRGDVGKNISYDATMGASAWKLEGSVHTLNPVGYEPYTFTKQWDGGLHGIDSLGSYRAWTDVLAFGVTMGGEISASFWDNRLDLRFGRIRHEWGFGEGSLYMDAMGRPFVAFEMTARPWKWLDFSTMYGVLEYYVYPEEPQPGSDWIQTVSAVQQNAYSILQLDIKPTKWMTLSVWDAAVYPKRSELGYPHPFISQFMYQNVSGDFDNMMIGGSLVLDWPGYFRFYSGLYVDEWSLGSDDFFKQDRNMYSFQTGIKAPIPIRALPWSRLALQYTKIEPYCYTHPPTKTPWYTDNYNDDMRDPASLPSGWVDADHNDPLYNMETGYLNNGEPMGYHLEPNSDELLLLWSAYPVNWIRASFKYRMIRHGGDNVDGSSYLDYIPYYTYTPDWKTDPLYTKDFLKDGEYEWFHIWALGVEMDFRPPNNYPLTLGIKYAFVYDYLTDYANTGHFRAIDGSSNYSHILSIQAVFYPY